MSDKETMARYWTYWYERHMKEAADAKELAIQAGATFAAPEVERNAKDQLRAVLEGLECQRIDILMTQGAPTLRAIAERIALAAKLGAHLMPPDSLPQRGSPQEGR